MEVSGYNLSWSTFSRHLAQLSRELHSEKYFSDVTLVSDDLVQTEAHRIILSASSPLLKSLLMISPRGQTQLFLKGVKHQQLEAVLKFLYYGEVQVPSAEIKEFLRAGTELEITELMSISEKREGVSDEGICEEKSVGNTLEEELSENILNIKEEEKECEIKEAEGMENVPLYSQDKVSRKRGPFWRFFRDDPDDETKVFCLIPGCQMKVSRGKTGARRGDLSSGGLVKHLKNKHSEKEYQEYLQMKYKVIVH